MNLFVFAFRFDRLKTETISYIEMAKCPSAHPSASGPHSLDHESCRFVPPPHCEIKTISKKLHTLQHNAVKSMLAIEYWCARKQEQDCASEVKDVVRLLDHELGNCLTGLENIVKVVNTLEEENKRLRQDLEQKKKIISDLSFEDIQQIKEKEQVQNMTTTMTTGTENTEQKIILNDINEKQHTSQN